MRILIVCKNCNSMHNMFGVTDCEHDSNKCKVYFESGDVTFDGSTYKMVGDTHTVNIPGCIKCS